MVSFSKRLLRATVVGAALLASACSSGGFGDISPREWIAGGTDKEAEQASLERFAKVTVCPEVQVRDGTQLLRVLDTAKGAAPDTIRFQASIRKFARECHTDPTTGATTIKVGVFGRMLAGPSGATGSNKLPVRVVLVRNGDEILYSQLFDADATIGPGMNSVDWTVIAEGLTVPADKSSGGMVIYVGFDETQPKAGKKKG